jgi:hypothetical protein
MQVRMLGIFVAVYQVGLITIAHFLHIHISY